MALVDIEYLFKKYYKRLYQTAYQIIQNEAIADDIVQEVFIHIWNKHSELQITTTIEGYLVKSTVNKALDYLKKNKRVLKVQLHQDMELTQLQENHIDYELFQKMVYLALDNLPPKCKTIFVLSRFENMRNKEISEYLDISIKTVENQINIAINKLNLELKPKIKNHFPEIF